MPDRNIDFTYNIFKIKGKTVSGESGLSEGLSEIDYQKSTVWDTRA